MNNFQNIPPHISRVCFALKLSGVHLLCSLILASAAAWLVLKIWYPQPYAQILGGVQLLLMIVAIDVICGPLLTLILANPKKSKRETAVDLALVVAIQLAALAYGMYTVYQARPVHYAFDQDRFTVVTAAQIDAADLSAAPEGLKKLPHFGISRISLAEIPESDKPQSVLLSLGGVEPVARPGLWLPFDAEKEAPLVRQAMKPLADLLKRRPEQDKEIQAALAETGLPEAEAYYLPFTSDKNKEWSALLNKDGQIVGYMPVDGFE